MIITMIVMIWMMIKLMFMIGTMKVMIDYHDNDHEDNDGDDMWDTPQCVLICLYDNEDDDDDDDNHDRTRTMMMICRTPSVSLYVRMLMTTMIMRMMGTMMMMI